ncbi:MAG TPA: endo-1,4-beta-xylanase [Bacteroidales bacterium]|nr:endo-1,4-beta-xylanase [Bacteroidales bacterium]
MSKKSFGIAGGSIVVVIITAVYMITASGSKSKSSSSPAGEDRVLKNAYNDYFSIGAAINGHTIEGPDSILLMKHFNSVTPENALKPGPVHPEEGTYSWGRADRIVNFALRHQMRIHGHVLVWHEQAADWMFTTGGRPATKEELLGRMKEHIFTVVQRYKGKIGAWDVVNEAVADNGPDIFRHNIWYDICGEDYVKQAFIYAHEADPQAKLYYNDYNIIRPDKRERAYELLKSLLYEGVQVDGVGIQGHWSIYEPSEKELRDAITRFSSLGLDVQITELDMSVYKWEKDRRDKRVGESDDLTPGREAQQVAQYDMIFKTLRDYKDKIDAVTLWGVTDRSSWLNYSPVRGRKNYPLLFDREGKPKKAFYKVVDF